MYVSSNPFVKALLSSKLRYRSFIASQSTMGKMSVDERSPVDIDGRVLERVKLLGHLKIGHNFFCCGAIKDNP